jgi:hypothetical protein
MNMNPATRSMLAIYRDPLLALNLNLEDWPNLMGAMRRAGCMGRVGVRLQTAGVLSKLPDPVQGHFETVRVIVSDRRHRLRWELDELAIALRTLAAPVVVLKGAAYEIQSLPLASGRMPGDVDLLVPSHNLSQAESLLKLAGWVSQPLSPYDERYYRDWSHEIPPLRHPARGVEVDLHHAITPELKGRGIDSALLLESSRPCGFFRVLDPLDQVIHTAVHTFKDSDLGGRMREVMDFDLLVRTHGFVGSEDRTVALTRRASALGAGRELRMAARFAHRWFGTPLASVADPTSINSVSEGTQSSPGWATVIFDSAVDIAMLPGQRQLPSLSARLVRAGFLSRYHLRRMPAKLLLPHLAEKAKRRWAPED